jgi:putative membrane protein
MPGRDPDRVSALNDPKSTQPEDATRRTWLAHERTYLAWWRTGLTAFAVGIGAGRIVPALTKGDKLPYALLGGGFALLGIFFMAYALYRHRTVERALQQGGFVRPDDWVVVAVTLVSVVLGLGVLVLVATET